MHHSHPCDPGHAFPRDLRGLLVKWPPFINTEYRALFGGYYASPSRLLKPLKHFREHSRSSYFSHCLSYTGAVVNRVTTSIIRFTCQEGLTLLNPSPNSSADLTQEETFTSRASNSDRRGSRHERSSLLRGASQRLVSSGRRRDDLRTVNLDKSPCSRGDLLTNVSSPGLVIFTPRCPFLTEQDWHSLGCLRQDRRHLGAISWGMLQDFQRKGTRRPDLSALSQRQTSSQESAQ